MSLPVFTPEELDTFRTMAPLIGAAVTGMGALATILNLKRRIAAALGAWAVRRREAREEKERQEALRVDWYTKAYRDLCINGEEGRKMSPDDFHRMTIQEACAHLGDVPDWAASVKWARRKVGRLR